LQQRHEVRRLRRMRRHMLHRQLRLRAGDVQPVHERFRRVLLRARCLWKRLHQAMPMRPMSARMTKESHAIVCATMTSRRFWIGRLGPALLPLAGSGCSGRRSGRQERSLRRYLRVMENES
jgi:hypothetical protein